MKSIGPIGDIDTETEVILTEHNLTGKSFDKSILEELPSSDTWSVDESEVSQKRRDLRHSHLVMSIDPKGCEDVDDTLSIRHLKNGHIELGVHIADVSYFVRPGSMTDKEASDRTTTIYLADRRYDMLPAVLSADLCSLLSQVDRYAVSVLWQLDSQYKVKEVWYGRTVIRSSFKLAYETAQALYDGVEFEKLLEEIPEIQHSSLSQQDQQKKLGELCEAIKCLVNITRVLKERRGGVELEGVELRVEIKDKTEVEDLISKAPLEMHEVIAECMIFANHWVAKKIVEAFPTKALLRHHPPPSQERFSHLKECAARKGFTMDTRSNKALALSLDSCVDPLDPDFNRILRYLAIQAMVPAHYFSTGSLPVDEYHHYGLDLDLYTHFTSPIRRYADLVVHRQLLAALENVPATLPTDTQLQELAGHCNKRHRSAQLSQIASTELFQGLYFLSDSNASSARQQRHEIDTIVINLRSNGLVVFSLRYGIRAPVYLRDQHGLVAQPDPSNPEKVIFNSGELTQSDDGITVSYSGGQYTLGILDHVRVRVTSKVSHAHGYSLALQLLSCGPVPLTTTADKQAEKDNKKWIKSVQQEAKQHKNESLISQSAFRQSDSKKSMYCTIQKMQRLSLQPV